MTEDTKITFYLEGPRSNETLCEETRTVKEWTGLTDAAMAGWSVLHLERVLEQVHQDWVGAQVLSGWRIAEDPEER